MRIQVNKKSSVWLIDDDNEVIFGAENMKVLKEHFKDSLKIDDDLKVTVINKDRFLSDRIFI